MEDSNIVDFFKQHDYVVKVYITGEKSCSAYLPSQIAINFNPETIYFYEIQDDELQCGIYYTSTEIHSPNFVSCPMYATRILIFQDIMMKTERAGLSTNFICYYDEEDNELENSTFVDLIKSSDDPKQIELEEKLGDIFYAAYPTFKKEYLTLAEKEGVAEGYELIYLAHSMEGL